MARRIRATDVLARFSRLRARRRQRVSQASVLSTIQRFGSTTKPRTTSGRLTMRSRQRPPRRAAPRRAGGARPPVSGVGEDGEDEGEQRPRAAVEHQRRAVAVLHAGRMHDDVQQQSERVDQDVVLDALDPLARVEADRVDRRAPFSAALTDLLSRMVAVGLASLPACSRQAT
jgi:hypothetical protein